MSVVPRAVEEKHANNSNEREKEGGREGGGEEVVQEKNAAPAGCTRMQEANGALLSREKREEDHRADERSRSEEGARERLVAEQIGESLLDPRNGSCPSKKERSGAGVAAAWQLPPTWDSPRSDSVFFILLVVVVVVVVVAVTVCCIGLVACRRYRSRGTPVFTCVTFVERRAVWSRVCVNLVIRPPPG